MLFTCLVRFSAAMNELAGERGRKGREIKGERGREKRGGRERAWQ